MLVKWALSSPQIVNDIDNLKSILAFKVFLTLFQLRLWFLLFLLNIHRNSFIFIQENALKISVYQGGGHFVRSWGELSCLSFKNRYSDSTRLVESHGVAPCQDLNCY